ncbi:hypothetical protein NFI96_024592 [Prochilodus magdalenae]|nr:hypothetical protein NFI96_024592 [Prochilodus magdalenae]
MAGLVEIGFCMLSLFHLAQARYISNDNNVFIYEESADSFLSRSLLYNSWDFELVTPGDLQRECFDEICSYEEAREVFEDDKQTEDFWKTYKQNSVTTARVDVPGLVSGILAAVIIAVIALVLGCYFYKNKGKSTRQRGRTETRWSITLLHIGTYCCCWNKTLAPVQMLADTRPAAEMVPLSNPPGLPSYNDALDSSGQYDGPPPPYSGETPTAPSAAQEE